jgi:hypothetical protein
VILQSADEIRVIGNRPYLYIGRATSACRCGSTNLGTRDSTLGPEQYGCKVALLELERGAAGGIDFRSSRPTALE